MSVLLYLAELHQRPTTVPGCWIAPIPPGGNLGHLGCHGAAVSAHPGMALPTGRQRHSHFFSSLADASNSHNHHLRTQNNHSLLCAIRLLFRQSTARSQDHPNDRVKQHSVESLTKFSLTVARVRFELTTDTAYEAAELPGCSTAQYLGAGRVRKPQHGLVGA